MKACSLSNRPAASTHPPPALVALSFDVLVLDQSGQIRYLNPSLEAQLGYAAADL